MDPLLEVIKFFAARLGGEPGTHRWEVVTAIFGWAAAAALIGGLGASLLGYDSKAKWITATFSAALAIALKRDLIRIARKSKK